MSRIYTAVTHGYKTIRSLQNRIQRARHIPKKVTIFATSFQIHWFLNIILTSTDQPKEHHRHESDQLYIFQKNNLFSDNHGVHASLGTLRLIPKHVSYSVKIIFCPIKSSVIRFLITHTKKNTNSANSKKNNSQKHPWTTNYKNATENSTHSFPI